MNTFQLECFLAVASSLSFTKAAENLNVTQTTITNQIKSLENELRIKLFNRSTRMVEITSAGHDFISDAESMLTIAAQAKLRFTSSAEKKIESIAVGCGTYLQLRLLTEIFHRMNNELTNFHPSLRTVPREQLSRLLETDQVEVIFDVREGCKLKGDVRFKEVLQSDIVCVSRKSDKFAGKEIISIEELYNESLIFCNPMSISPRMLKFQQQLAQSRTPENTHFVVSSESALILAAAGVGIAFLPQIYINEELNLQIMKFENAPRFSFGIFYKSGVGDSVVKKFVATTKEYFKGK